MTAFVPLVYTFNNVTSRTLASVLIYVLHSQECAAIYGEGVDIYPRHSSSADSHGVVVEDAGVQQWVSHIVRGVCECNGSSSACQGPPIVVKDAACDCLDLS